jgi:uncharacterized protein (TIRG00374 family)
MKRIAPILVSIALLSLIYWKIDLTRIWPVLRGSNVWWLAASIGLLIPSTMLAAWRLEQLMPGGRSLGVVESNRLIMVANVLNAFLPSRMGEISKAWFLKERGHLQGNLAIALVMFEKVCDLMALVLCCGFGLFFLDDKGTLFWTFVLLMTISFLAGTLFLRSKRLADCVFNIITRIAPAKLKIRLGRLQPAWVQMQNFLWQDPTRMPRIGALSLLITLINLVQIWFLILALKASVPFLVSLAMSPLAVFVGLMPVSFAGIGTRDAALIFFYRDYLDAPTAGALGLLCTLRYFVLAFAGIPLAGKCIANFRSKANQMVIDQTDPLPENRSKSLSLEQKQREKS